MKQTIRLNESDLHHMIKEVIKAILNEDLNEFDDWKAQMLHSDGKGNRDNNGIYKASKMAHDKYTGQGVSSNGIKYDNQVSFSNKNGRIVSQERNANGELIGHAGGFDLNPKGQWQASHYSKDGTEIGAGWYDQPYQSLSINTPEVNNFQRQAGNDMADYYSGNYRDRLRQKALQLGNTKSGQDFTPSVLKEAIDRAIRKLLR